MIFPALVLFFWGIILGSFLNACIYRFPRDISLAKPKHSICPHCQKKLAWYELIPLLSFLIQFGKCRHCHKQINIRYFLVELLSGMLFGALVFFPLTSANVILAFEIFLLLGIFFTDLETQIIPDSFSISGISLGLFYSYVAGDLKAGLLAAAAAGSIFWLISQIGHLIYKKEALGGGDIKLVIMLGSFLWLPRTLLMIYLSFILGSVLALILIITKKKTRKDYLSFGPIIILASIIVLFWGNIILKYFFPFL